METFEKDITFLSREFDTDSQQWEEKEVVKKATFKELSRTDRTQAKLHFKLVAIFENFGVSDEADASAKIDSDGLYDLTTKAIKTLLIIDDSFTEQDKTAFLNDSFAVLAFGLWALGEKFAPFFSTFKMN